MGPQPSGDAGAAGDEMAGQVGSKRPIAALFRIVGVAVGYLDRNIPSICQNPTDVSLFYEVDVECNEVLQKKTPVLKAEHPAGGPLGS